MSDPFYFTEITFKFKKAKFILPLNYLKDVLKGLQKLFFRKNILLDMKNSPINIYNRIFGTNSRQHIYNALVLIADLESNVGAACLELLNNETPEFLKHFSYRPNNSYNDDYLFFDDYYMSPFDMQISCQENIYDPTIDNIECIKEESKILEANLCSDMENQINTDYLMNSSLSVDNSLVIYNEFPKKGKVPLEPDIKLEQSYNPNNVADLKSWDWNSFDTLSFTEASNSDCESNYSIDNYDDKNCNHVKSIPKPIRREICQLKMLGVPFSYYDITQSSHEAFKTMKSKPELTKSQVSAMTNARRRYINRRAATRCRTQKLQQKDKLKLELDKLQNQLLQTKITLTKAYQQRNELRDQYRTIQRNLLIRLEGPDEKALNANRWSSELKENKSLVLIENIRSS